MIARTQAFSRILIATSIIGTACGRIEDEEAVDDTPVSAADAVARWEDVYTAGGVFAGRGATVRLPHAPFPHRSASFTDSRVRIFVPEGYRDRGAHDLILHFHGFWATLAETLASNDYQEHVFASGANAILVVPQGPVAAASGNFGKLMDPDQTALLLDDVLTVLARDGFITRAVLGGVVLTSHSGGYQATAMNLRGALPVRQVNLFDSLYGYESIFETYVVEGGRLRSNYTSSGGTLDNNEAAIAELERRGVTVATAPTQRALLSSPAVISFAATSHYGAIRLQNAYGDAIRFGVASSRHGPRIDLRTAIAGDDGTATVSWLAPADEDLVGFAVELEYGDGVWTIAAEVGPAEDRATFPFAGGAKVRVRSRMRDPAGEETLASDVFRMDEGARVLVVDHFDRLLGGGFGELAHDFAAKIGEAAGGCATIGHRAITEDQFDLSPWSAVIWSLGDQSTDDETFTRAEREAIARYLANGGHLVVSGSEVGYDLAGLGRGQAFLTDTLGATYLADASGRNDARGAGPLASIEPFNFGGAGAPYAIKYPDVIGAAARGTIVLQYGNGRAAAAGLAGRTVVTGFPLESIDTDEHRAVVTQALLSFAGH